MTHSKELNNFVKKIKEDEDNQTPQEVNEFRLRLLDTIISTTGPGNYYTLKDLFDERDGYVPFEDLSEKAQSAVAFERISRDWGDIWLLDGVGQWTQDMALEEVKNRTKKGKFFIDMEGWHIKTWMRTDLRFSRIIFKDVRISKRLKKEFYRYFELIKEDDVTPDNYYLTEIHDGDIVELRENRDYKTLITYVTAIKKSLPRTYRTVSTLKALYGIDMNPYYHSITDAAITKLDSIYINKLDDNGLLSEELEVRVK